MNFKILVLNFRKNVLTVIIFVLALYGVLCTVYSDVIVQNKNKKQEMIEILKEYDPSKEKRKQEKAPI
jgi:hypothetical protein